MRIDWNQESAGLDIASIRDVLIRSSRQDGTITLSSIAAVLPDSDRSPGVARGRIRQSTSVLETARRLLQTLAASGMIGADDAAGNDGDPIRYRLTTTALSLTCASRLKRITRARALEAVEELKSAAAAINADGTMMHDVAGLALYGSILTECPDLGDVDVALELRVRETDDLSADLEAFHDAHPQPLGFQDGCNLYRWPATVAERRLRVRRCISLSPMHNVRSLGCPMRMLLPEEIDVASSPGWSATRAEIVLHEDGGDALRALDEAILTRDAHKRRELEEFDRACLAGNPPPGADPERIGMHLLVARL